MNNTFPSVHLESLESRYPQVVIIGRPNVGKSSLFNLFAGRLKAIVHPEQGVTRDCISLRVTFHDIPATLVDTGGLGLFRNEKKGSQWDHLIRERLLDVLQEASVVIFMVEGLVGVHPLDEEIANILRELKKDRLVIVANKVDSPNLTPGIEEEFSRLGLGVPVIPFSCEHRIGWEKLNDWIIHQLRELKPFFPDVTEEIQTTIAIVGRPNVGKSSILNCLLGKQRVIVSDIPGTTRDAIDIPCIIKRENEELSCVLVDTAGIRRKGKVSSAIEFFSLARTEHAIEKADIVFIVLDASEPLHSIDKTICRKVKEYGKGTILILNKWDLVIQNQLDQKEIFRALDYDLPFMDYADRLLFSAITGDAIPTLIDHLFSLVNRLHSEYPTPLVNRVLEDAVSRNPPPAQTHQVKFYYGTCVSTCPPTFKLFVNYAKECPHHYSEYLTKQFANAFNIRGIPVKLILENRPRKERSRPPQSSPSSLVKSKRTPSTRKKTSK